ncbi:unnamed protein product [Mytilus edulis]|uniref:ANK_REP_REGION domain-containing protein n=1 Tax=Mytilus edulis TaxID=6550 RepID=A0A8S3V0E7_MYTED|nr:unnamed protein product [Mytilus edulis]
MLQAHLFVIISGFKCCQTEYTDNSVALETEMEEEYFDRLLDDLKNGKCRQKNQAEYNYYSNFTNPWIEAAFAGFIDLFKFLIDLEWNQIQSHIRISTLYAACRNGNVDIVSLLLNGNTNIAHNTVTTVHLAAAQTLLLVACLEGHQAVVQILLNSITDLSQFIKKDIKSILHNACEDINTDLENLFNISTEHNAEISPCGRSKKSPFFVACEKGYGDIVRILIESNVDVFECDRYGRSSLYVACKNGNFEIVNILLSNDVATFKHDKYGKSPMCVACEGGHLHIVNLLLKNSFDFSHCVYRECSLIITALGKGHIEIANMLLQNNTDRCQCDGFERTPCGIVCETENGEITNILTKLYDEYSTQCVGDTNTVEILFYSRFFSDYKILHLHIPRLRLYTEIFNHFLKSEQQNENKPNNQE